MQAEHERRMKDIEIQLRGAETAVVEWIDPTTIFCASSSIKFSCYSPSHRVVSPQQSKLAFHIAACSQSYVNVHMRFKRPIIQLQAHQEISSMI